MKGWCVRKGISSPNRLALAAKVNLVYRFIQRYYCKIALEVVLIEEKKKQGKKTCNPEEERKGKPQKHNILMTEKMSASCAD